MGYSANEMQKQYQYRERTNVNIPCISLCALIVLVFGVVPKIPYAVTQLFRPALILICLLIPSRAAYKMRASSKLLMVFLFYLTIVFLCHPITSSTFSGWASVVLFGAFYLVITFRVWNRYELQMIIKILAFSCTLFAIIILFDNPKLFKSGGGSHVSFLGATVNTNSGGFDIAPGTVCSMLLLFFSPWKTTKMKRVLYLGCVLICYAVLAGLAGRSAFFASCFGGVVIIWARINQSTNRSQKNTYRFVFILSIVLILYFAPSIFAGTSAERLFDYKELTNMNGRDELADMAWELINKKPLFGGGFAYWAETGSDLTAHNTFLNFGVQGGYTALILIGSFFLSVFYELSKAHDLIPISFAVIALLHSFTETVMSYYAYIPLVVAYIIMQAEITYDCRVHTLLSRN